MRQKRFKLKKDLPGFPSGRIFKVTNDGSSIFSSMTDDEYIYDKTLHCYKFPIEIITNNPDWFEEFFPDQIKVVLNDEVFFGEELLKIGEFSRLDFGERQLTEIFKRSDGNFVIRKTLPERGNPEPSYDFINKEAYDLIHDYIIHT